MYFLIQQRKKKIAKQRETGKQSALDHGCSDMPGRKLGALETQPRKLHKAVAKAAHLRNGFTSQTRQASSILLLKQSAIFA